MQDLTAQQSRQLIDCEQLYTAYRDADRDLASRFAGAMSWKTVKGRTYLYRKSASVWKSLGPQDDHTLAIHAQFHAGRDDRDPLKRRRDHHQAHTLAAMLATRLPSLRLDDPMLHAVPAAVLGLGRAEMDRFCASAGAMEQEDWDG